MLVDVKMTTIVGILKFMSETNFMNVLRFDLVAYVMNNMSRLKNILQAFELCNFIKVLSLSC